MPAFSGHLLPVEMAAPTGVETVDSCDCWECRDGDLRMVFVFLSFHSNNSSPINQAGW